MSLRSAAILVAVCVLPGCGEKPASQEKSAAASSFAPPAVAAAPGLDDGRRVFEHWCLPCHAAGPGHPGTNRLAERLGPETAVLLERDNLNDAYVEAVVRNGFQMMPPFRATEISDDELKAVGRYVATGGGRRNAPGAGP
jgi:cytochrome c5